MCNWRAGDRTFMGHIRECYPRTYLYMLVMVSLILIVTVLDLTLEVIRG